MTTATKTALAHGIDCDAIVDAAKAGAVPEYMTAAIAAFLDGHGIDHPSECLGVTASGTVLHVQGSEDGDVLTTLDGQVVEMRVMGLFGIRHEFFGSTYPGNSWQATYLTVQAGGKKHRIAFRNGRHY
jgi:hypothetical protein